MEIRVPDIGGFDAVEVIEVLIKNGQAVAKEESLITLESDKATMEVPSPADGTITAVHVKVGDKIAEGDLIASLEEPAAQSRSEKKESPALAATSENKSASPTPAPVNAAASSVADGNFDTDVLVLGGGPGGYTAAFRAADLGLSVTLVEKRETLGGVCLNVGCIPSKALLHAAKVIDEAKSFAAHGITFSKPEIDLDALRQWKESVITKLTSGLTGLAKQRKVKVVRGEGKFVGPHEVSVKVESGDERALRFRHAIIAAGSRPTVIPPFPNDDPRLIDSTGALDLVDVPQKLLIIGGGIIGLEMATVYHQLGSRVSIVEMMDRLMNGCDKDIVRPFQKRIADQYEAIYLNTQVMSIEPTPAGLVVSFKGDKAPAQETYDRVLVAVGRQPNGGLINAQAAGVNVDERGFIAVDKQMRTNVPHIFAIGDLVGQPMLAHKATHEGKVAAEVIAGHKVGFDALVIPSVAYTDPEVAWVGVTEEQAKAQGIKYGKGAFPWAASGRSLSLGRDEGMTKLLFDEDTGRIIGGAIVGPGAGELIAEVGLAIEMGCDAEDIGLTVHAHPTLSETVAMSAEAFAGTLTDLYVPKKK